MESVGHSSVEEVEKSIEDDDDDDEDDPLITNAKLRIKIQDQLLHNWQYGYTKKNMVDAPGIYLT